ncbi:MAG: DUF445 domain-containing protein, partial [Candidatus Cloacimonadota bacterium]|nr:DUF445 domain-containing protein [Candidatus Cloacimonadota bacterium]
SLVTNSLAMLTILFSFLLPNSIKMHVLDIGLFALSGAITNWLAIYMLFEKVPGLYGSGVIPARFEDFKKGIFDLIMNQFFTEENISRFFEDSKEGAINLDIHEIIDELDMNSAWESLVKVIMDSQFGGMLEMFGGVDALQPLKEPFINNLKGSIFQITEADFFHEKIKEKIEQSSNNVDILEKVSVIVKKRLEELTPQMVKEIIQEMIRKHLGWLVVWGGVFGGLIGLITSFFA